MTTIEELRRLHEAATPGPWVVKDVGGEPEIDGIVHASSCGDAGPTWGENDAANADLIVALRNKLPALLRCIEAADKLANLYHPADFAGMADAYRQARAELEES